VKAIMESTAPYGKFIQCNGEFTTLNLGIPNSIRGNTNI